MKGEKSNTDLLKLLKKGNIRAFDAIYEKYSKRLYVFVFRYIKQKTDAEEIVQEVFLKIWESREKIDLYSSFDSFLFTIAYNNTISLLRKRVNEKKYLEHLKHKQQVSDNEGIIAEMHFKEIEKRVKSLLEQLTPRQKEIFYLSREEGLTHEEIAKKLNISANTVKNHLVATLAFLKSGISGNMLAIMLFVHLFL
ncbi:RNA polymerase sigma factor [Mariniphaga sediminis]|uniref:RNA polymerase sigma factor n=1 Tax=Mariniphaga sediminis TaxID=1628158 RepID=UPI003562924D